MNKSRLILVILAGLNAVLLGIIYHCQFGAERNEPKLVGGPGSVIVERSTLVNLNNGKWIGSFRAHDGSIYLRDHLKSVDGGKTVIQQDGVDVEALTKDPGLTAIAMDGLFYATGGTPTRIGPGMYRTWAWRSTDELKSIAKEEVLISIPQGPQRDAGPNEWYGVHIHRSIVQLTDRSWLMTMYGNFSEDTLLPQDLDASKETTYMTRAFVVRSIDKGHSWQFVSNIAVPRFGDPVGEGFGEPTMVLLEDGTLLTIMRTGHHFPLYASWSSDQGKSWTAPTYTGLDRGCDPHLIRLRDGRLVLSWGRRYPEGWSKIVPEGDQSLFKYPGKGYLNLAVSNDNGRTWENDKVASEVGSAYSTIFEVEPNVLFVQVDQWYWRIQLRPRVTGRT